MRGGEQYKARGWTDWGPFISAVNSQCIPAHDIREGEKFVAFLRMKNLRSGFVLNCGTEVASHSVSYVQQDRSPYRKVWYWVTGNIWRPRCVFSHEK